MKKLSTIDLKGKAYATVPTRIKEFRESCPNGVIETESKRNGEEVEFIATIFKDGNNRNVGKGSGHSFGIIKIEKSYEKLETIAIGRALAVLGFMASGEVASFEEMEEFLSDKESKKILLVQELKAKVDEIKTITALRKFYTENRGNGAEFDAYMMNKAKELEVKKK